MTNAEIIERNYAEAVKGIKEEWFVTVNPKWYDYIIRLPMHLQVVYLVSILDGQVRNGGFDQYFANGYGQFAKETIPALIEIGALKKAELLKEALGYVNAENDTDVVFRGKLLNFDIKPLFDNELMDVLDRLDAVYYADETEDLSQLLGDYLRSY